MSEETKDAVETAASKLAEDVKSKLQAEGADMEKARVSAISKLPAAGQEALKLECIADPDCTVEQATHKLMEAMSNASEEAIASVKKQAKESVFDGISSADSDPVKEQKSGWDDPAIQASFGGNKAWYDAFNNAKAAGLVTIGGKQ